MDTFATVLTLLMFGANIIMTIVLFAFGWFLKMIWAKLSELSDADKILHERCNRGESLAHDAERRIVDKIEELRIAVEASKTTVARDYLPRAEAAHFVSRQECQHCGRNNYPPPPQA